MNADVKPIRPPVLRVLAWIAASLLVIGWVCLPFVFLSLGRSLPSSIYFWSHLGAFIVGLCSFERLGGISAGLAALTLTLWLAWSSALSAAG